MSCLAEAFSHSTHGAAKWSTIQQLEIWGSAGYAKGVYRYQDETVPESYVLRDPGLRSLAPDLTL